MEKKSDWKAALRSLDLVIADPKASVEEKSTARREGRLARAARGGDAGERPR
jgi:hypothetical protein